ncbi:MAG: FadR family transcriptional regulator [Bryobacterales bacterium]|nr:FadR family transcriptional regulator [Bryobacterales bacterium]
MAVSKTRLSVESIDRAATWTAVTFERLVKLILSGQWPEGARIPPERELCLQLGIARASLREAVKALELIGVLESRVGDGTFICPRSEFLSRPLLWAITGTDLNELRDIIEARRLIEEDIASLAAERANQEELQKIAAAVEDLRAALPDPEACLAADLRFHLAIAEAAHNQILLNSVQLLRNLMKQWILLKLQIPGTAVRVLEQHEVIYSAIRMRDASLAREAMSKHLSTMGKLLIEAVHHH